MALKFRPLLVLLCSAALLVGIGVPSVSADPASDQILLFEQEPMIDTHVGGGHYPGHDEISAAEYLGFGICHDFLDCWGGIDTEWMADDFAFRTESEIVHVEWWGSYASQPVDLSETLYFLIEILTDVPADPDPLVPGFSRPGELLQDEVLQRDPSPSGMVPSAGGYFTEEMVASTASNVEPTYHYNAALRVPFSAEADTVYWLKIVALMRWNDPEERGPLWGWHNRDYTVENTLASTTPAVTPGEAVVGRLGEKDIWHFQDDAVQGDFFLIEIDPTEDPPVLAYPPQESGPEPQKYRESTGEVGDGPEGIAAYSKDLAFKLYAPEPGSGLLSGVALLTLAALRRLKTQRQS